MSTRKSYKKEDLDKYVEDNNIELIGEYHGVNRDKIIKGCCTTYNCDILFEKQFRMLVKTAPYCIECMKKIKEDNRINTNLQKYGTEYPTQSTNVINGKNSYKKEDLDKYVEDNNIELIGEYNNVNCETRIDGKCNNIDCIEIFNKKFYRLVNNTGPYCKNCTKLKANSVRKETCNKNFGGDTPYSSELVKKKGKETCKEKYGVENPFQSEEIKNKIKNSMVENHGVENPSQSEEIKKKKIETWKINLGVEHPSQSEEIKNKKIKTCLRNHGVKHPVQSEEIRKKAEETCFKNHGVKHPAQSEEIRKKAEETCFKNHGVKNPVFSKKFQEKMLKAKYNKYSCKDCGLFLVFNHLRKNNDKQDDLCDYCQPMKTNKLREKTKELQVVRDLNKDLPDYPFIHNRTVGNECTLQDRENTNGHLYPDIRFDQPYFQLIVEVDEHRHRGSTYSCDERRMYEIVKQLGLPCVFIRFNPDDKKSNYDTLLSLIKEYLYKSESEEGFNSIDFNELSGLKVKYLFYD